ncbi:TPM domain-containing protein [Caulobacter sp. DWR1-3-2b1]|uniref:TPM domain-containing protein n=1 Tax=Caulobacter sp. DWR1-3-2b1 TaxID=2804670 RepID=UPI003CEB90BE
MRKMTPEDQARIADAVAAAEKTTAGEIFCVLAPEVSDYRETPLVWAAAVALVLPAVALFAGLRPDMLTSLFGGWTVGHASATDAAILSALSIYIGLQVAAFIVAALLVSIPPIRRALTPRALKAAAVKRAAMEQFMSHGLHLTRDRTGVLIFAALAEHRVEVIADEGIYKAAPNAVWDEVVADLVAGMKAGRIADGFVAAVTRVGEILASHVPVREADTNELSDGLTILPRN